jgi:hypothetical protein
MKQIITSRFYFAALISLILVAAASCSKEEKEENINNSIFFDVNISQGKFGISYGPLVRGKRPEDILGALIGSEEVIDADGKLYNLITLFVATKTLSQPYIKLGQVMAFLKLIKAGGGIEGIYQKRYVDPQLGIITPNHISLASSGDYYFGEEGLQVNIEKLGLSDISGKYAEGSYTAKG